MMTQILGLVTCFNRKEKTVKALTNLIQGNPEIQFSFIVVDDGSTDGTKEALEQMPQVQVITGHGNLFYSGGMRVAIREGKALGKTFDYCLLFNDDVEFWDNAIQTLCKKEKNTIWIGPTCEKDGSLSYGGVVKTSKWRPKTEIVMAETEEGRDCDTFNANCVLIPWDIFMALENIDDTYTHSIGDFDYGFVASKKGYTMKVSNQYVGECPDNPVKSNHNWRNTELSRKRRIQLKESPKGLPLGEYFHYLNKNYNIFTAIVYSAMPYVRILLKK